MRNNFRIVAFLSATVLLSTVSPSLSEALNSNPLDGERPIVRSIADNSKSVHGEPVLAQAERISDTKMPQRLADRWAEPQRRDRGTPRGPMHAGPYDLAPDMNRLGLDFAAELAAMETYVGITTEQLDAWRAYASALINFFEPPDFRPSSFGPRPGDDMPPRGPDEGPRDDDAQPVPLFATRLANQVIARGEVAQTLKSAAEELRSALSPDQFERLAEAERSLAFILHPRGPMEDRPIPHRPGNELPAPVREK